MQIVFNPIPKEFLDGGEKFFSKKGKAFYFMLDVHNEGNGEGTFELHDSCGRMIPFDFSSLDDLVDTLTTLQTQIHADAQYSKFWTKVWEN